MKKSVAVLAATAVAGGLAVAIAPTANAYEIEREKYKRCGPGVAHLSLDKEYGRIDVDLEVENVAPNRWWRLRILHNGKVKANASLPSDYEGDVDISRNVKDKRGKDKFTARATGPNGENCVVKLSI